MRTLLAIAGSLRSHSYNRLLLRAAGEQAPLGMTISTYDSLGAIPLFNGDLEDADPKGSESVQTLRDLVATTDGLLIATPEYNWGIPGVLKNAIDWLSRPPREVLRGKPIAIVGVTSGRWGTRLAQAALRQVLTATESVVMPTPSLFVSHAASMFDQNGRLIDSSIQEQLDAVLVAFAEWLEPRVGVSRNNTR